MYTSKTILSALLIGGLIGMFPLLNEKAMPSTQLEQRADAAVQIEKQSDQKVPDLSSDLKTKTEPIALSPGKPAENELKETKVESSKTPKLQKRIEPVVHTTKQSVLPVKKVQEKEPSKETMQTKSAKKMIVANLVVQNESKKTTTVGSIPAIVTPATPPSSTPEKTETKPDTLTNPPDQEKTVTPVQGMQTQGTTKPSRLEKQ